MRIKIPVALFAYNRPDHTQRALNALNECHRVGECDFHFFSDGPLTKEVQQDVDKTRSVLGEWALKMNASVIERPQNLGLAKSIVIGVSDLVARYGRVIVVEDDLVVAPDFLHYMMEALNHYEEEDRVMQVAAFTISSPGQITADAFLLPVTTTWGWATWKRAWQFFSWRPKDLETAIHDEEWLRIFNLNETCSYTKMLEDRLASRNDSWGILWWYAVSRRRGMVVYPKQSLVWNSGFDGSGVHCGSDDFLGQKDHSHRFRTNLQRSLTFPSVMQYEPAHLLQLENFFRSCSRSGCCRATLAKGMKSRFKTLGLKLKAGFRNAFH